MRQIHRSIGRDPVWKRVGRWLHGDSHDVMRRLRLIKVGVVGVGALIAVSAMIVAQPTESNAFQGILNDFNVRYDTENTRIDDCSLCHTSEFGFNPYGRDFKDGGEDFAAIEGNDSDGDGSTNIEEIAALTFPGDPNDVPPPTTVPPTTTTPPPSGENHDPEAEDDSYKMAVGTVLEVAAPGVLANDSDEDGDALTVRLGERLPKNGKVVLYDDGSFTYTPDDGFVGEDRFTYQAFDGRDYSEDATVEIKVEGTRSERLKARRDSYRTTMDSPLEIAAPGVLANDGKDDDHDRDDNADDDANDRDVELTARMGARLPSHGTVVLNEDGSFTYTPDDGFVGRDRFTYRAFDGSRYSKDVTVKIRVKASARTPRERSGHVETTPQRKHGRTWPLQLADDALTFSRDAVTAAEAVVASAIADLGTWNVVPDASPAVQSANPVQLQAGVTLSGEVLAAAQETAAETLSTTGTPGGAGEGASPLTVVLLTLILSAGAFGLIMVAGEH